MKYSTYLKSWISILFVPFLCSCNNANPLVEALSSKTDADPTHLFTVTLDQATAQADPTNSSTVQFNVVFSSAINLSSFTDATITLDPSSTATVSTWTVTDSGDGKNFVLTAQASSAGVIKPLIPAGSVQSEDGLTTFSASTSTDNSVIYDNQGPSVSINQALTQFDPARVFPVSFNLVFNEAIDPTTLTVADISNSGTAAGIIWSLTNIGDNINFTLQAVSSSSNSGTIIPSLAAGTVMDRAGNNNSAATSSDNSVTYDGIVPTVLQVTSSAADGSYSSGSILSIQVVFSETVTVTGTPQLELETGTTNKLINYVSGSGTTTLQFSYTVGASDLASDLDFASTNALTLNAGTIADSATNAADLTLPNFSSGSSLADQKNIVIIGSPAILSISDGTTYDYGSVAIGNSTDKTFTVTNIGGFSANSISSSGLAAPFIFKDGNYPGTGGTCLSTLASGATCTIVITYSPVSAGLQSDSVEISYNDGISGQSVSRSMQGTGVIPALLSISNGPNFDFGTFSIYTSSDVSFTISNTGSLAATSMSATALTAPFSFKGGVYPGAGGSCSDTVPGGASCTVIVTFAPTSIGTFNNTIDIQYNDGVVNTNTTRNIQGTGGPIALDVVPVYGSANGDSNTNWNDYIKFNNNAGGSSPYNQDIEPCDGSETGYYEGTNGCIHSAEKKKVVVTGVPSCNGLTISDSLGVFSWKCDASSGTAIFYSTTLKTGKGLRNLISGSSGPGTWLNNSVTVSNGATIGTSASSAWWNNSIQEAPASDPSSATVISLSTPGTIYYVPNSRQYQIVDIASDKISLVTLGASTIGPNNYGGGGAGLCNTTDGTTGTGILSLLCINDVKFLWIEANLIGNGVTWLANTGIFAYNLKYSRIHRTSMNSFHVNVTHPGLNLTNSSYNMISENEIATVSKGVYLANSTYNTFRGLKVADSRGTASAGSLLQIVTSSIFNRFYDLTLMNLTNSTSSSAQGISVAASNNIFQRVMISNINGPSATSAGIKVANTGNIFVQVGAFSTTNTGIHLAGGSNNIFSHVTSANNTYNGLYITGSNTGNYFQSISIANTEKGVQSASGTNSGNVIQSISSTNNTTYGFEFSGGGFTFPGYAIVGNNGTTDCTGSPCSSASLVSGVDASNAFVGKVTSDDTSNPTDFVGSGTPSSLGGFLYFDHWLRGWGKDGGAFPFSDNRGYCGSGCRIWDWRIATSGALHNKSQNGSTSNDAFIAGSACPAAVNGNEASTANGKTFLRNAVEIDGDYIGNDNGLCESNEACMYAPNIGSYQGEGSKTGPCNFTSGSVTGVTIYSYTTTGQ